MGYDVKKFRSVKHGMSDISAYCRHCGWSCFDSKSAEKARHHARANLHTVDVYREHHTEYTCHVKKW